MNRLVSVIVPNYNYARYLKQAIDSVLEQSYPELEVIVVDDGSSDDSELILQSYGDRIRWIKQKNQGVAAARNRGVTESNGELVAFLDADDLWLPSKIERQMHRFEQEPDVGLIHCGVVEIYETGAHLRSRLDGLEGWVAKELLLFKRAVILGGGSGMLVPRKTFDAIQGFDTRLSTSADWDFFYRIAARQRVAFVPEPLIKYRIHANNMHANVRVMEHDVMIGYAKAFDTDDPELLAMRKQCYGRMHLVLAGSYFRAGEPYNFARHALTCVRYAPKNLVRILESPIRWLKRDEDN